MQILSLQKVLRYYQKLAPFGGRCAYCQRQMAQIWDRLIPRTRGGKHTLHNLVPACQSCKVSKGSQEVTAWLAREHMQACPALFSAIKVAYQQGGQTHVKRV
jgi:hypothetical protein